MIIQLSAWDDKLNKKMALPESDKNQQLHKVQLSQLTPEESRWLWSGVTRWF